MCYQSGQQSFTWSILHSLEVRKGGRKILCCHYTREKDHDPSVAVTDQSPFCQSQAKHLHMSSSTDLTPASEASSASPIQIYPLSYHTGCNLGIAFVGGIPQRVRTAAACRICGFESGVRFRRQEHILEGHVWSRCSLGTHEPDHRPAHCNVRQSVPSLSLIHI